MVEDIPIISRQISREISKTGSLGQKSAMSDYEGEVSKLSKRAN